MKRRIFNNIAVAFIFFDTIEYDELIGGIDGPCDALKIDSAVQVTCAMVTQTFST
jgi:hypothetical protein